MYKNNEGYSDPTAGAALSNLIREFKQKQRQEWRERYAVMHRPKVYIASPYAGDTEANVKAAVGYCIYAIRQKRIPVASHLIYPAVLSDAVAAERNLGMLFGLSLLAMCDEVWVCGSRISDGMEAEIAEAKRLNKPIRYVREEVLI